MPSRRPDFEKLEQCPPAIQLLINQMAPQDGEPVHFDRIRYDDQAFWIDRYANLDHDVLKVRRDTGAFCLELSFPVGMRSGYIHGVYNTDANKLSISDIGNYGAAVSLHSTDESEIVTIYKKDYALEFQNVAMFLDSLAAEKKDRRPEFIGQYAVAWMEMQTAARIGNHNT